MLRFFSSIADVLPFSTYDIIWITSYFVNTHFAMRRKGRFPIPCVPAGCGQRGPFSHVREWPPLDPPREREGSPPRPPTLAVSILKNCSACGIGCSVHGFAMNPYFSSPLSTAPYYREARVTFIWQQTACEIAALLALAALLGLAVDDDYCALLQDGQSGSG